MSLTDEQIAEALAFLRGEAESQPVDRLHEYVVSEMEAMFDAINAIPAEDLERVPEGEEWSPLRALQHAVQANVQVAEDVLNVCLTGERPGNPEPALPMDRDVLIAKQREMNASLWEHVSFADPAAFLDVTWPHMFFGELNWREWFLFLHLHAWDHGRQITALGEKLRA